MQPMRGAAGVTRRADGRVFVTKKIWQQCRYGASGPSAWNSGNRQMTPSAPFTGGRGGTPETRTKNLGNAVLTCSTCNQPEGMQWAGNARDMHSWQERQD